MSSFARSISAKCRPIRVAIIGTGASGSYCAKFLKKFQHNIRLQVDFFEKLGHPHGLIKYGVAVDHPKIKRIQRELELLSPIYHDFVSTSNIFDDSIPNETVESYTLRVFKNVHIVGSSKKQQTNNQLQGSLRTMKTVPLDELRFLYDSVILATGASRPKRLQIEGSNLRGVIPALHLMQWTNGYWNEPLARQTKNSPTSVTQQSFSESIETLKSLVNQKEDQIHRVENNLTKLMANNAFIMGFGNVALDVTRMLLKDMSSSPIDIEAEEFLRKLNISRTYIAGRRSLADSTFSTKNLREVFTLPETYAYINRADLISFQTKTNSNRVDTKKHELFASNSCDPSILDLGTQLGQRNTKMIRFLPSYVPIKYVSLKNNQWIHGVYLKHTETNHKCFVPAKLVIESLGFEQNSDFKDLPMLPTRDAFLHENYCILPRHQNAAPVFGTGWCISGGKGSIPITLAHAMEASSNVLKEIRKNLINEKGSSR